MQYGATNMPDHPPYRLAPHAYACQTGKHILMLDVRRDRYLGVNGGAGAWLKHWIADWPAPPASDAESRDDGVLQADIEQTLGQLIHDDLLVPSDKTQLRNSSALEPAEYALTDGYLEERVTLGPRDVHRFIKAMVATRLMIRFYSLEQLVKHAANRRRRSGNAKSTDLERLRMHVAAYTRMTPWLLTARDACLANSLAMGEFLAPYGFFPTWVFGVTVEPFSAHCWLQMGRFIVNDTPDKVLRYTPIMAI